MKTHEYTDAFDEEMAAFDVTSLPDMPQEELDTLCRRIGKELDDMGCVPTLMHYGTRLMNFLGIRITARDQQERMSTSERSMIGSKNMQNMAHSIRQSFHVLGEAQKRAQAIRDINNVKKYAAQRSTLNYLSQTMARTAKLID